MIFGSESRYFSRRVIQEYQRKPIQLNLPLLGFVPASEQRDRDEDGDSLASVTDLDLRRVLVSAKLPSAHRLFGIVFISHMGIRIL